MKTTYFAFPCGISLYRHCLHVAFVHQFHIHLNFSLHLRLSPDPCTHKNHNLWACQFHDHTLTWKGTNISCVHSCHMFDSMAPSWIVQWLHNRLPKTRLAHYTQIIPITEHKEREKTINLRFSSSFNKLCVWGNYLYTRNDYHHCRLFPNTDAKK